MAGIVVVGSSNTDMVVTCPHIPRPGETVIGGDLAMVAGGKGANQAVAAARLGASVTFVACLGHDPFGDAAEDAFRKESIDTRYLVRDGSAPSGVALICVEESGENAIAVAPGANSHLVPQHVLRARAAFEQADLVLLQLEISLETVAATVELASETGTQVILNPAPARALPAELLSSVGLITPNRTEVATLCGLPAEKEMSPSRLSEGLQSLGCTRAVVTLGAQGCLIVDKQTLLEIPAFRVDPVDTTAAGDAFNGALAVAIAEGQSLETAAVFASAAAAISVTRLGAQPSMPARAQVEELLSTAGFS